MFDELWAFHPDYPDYMISTYGGVYSLLTAQFLKPRITSGAYYVQLKGIGKFDEKSWQNTFSGKANKRRACRAYKTTKTLS